MQWEEEVGAEAAGIGANKFELEADQNAAAWARRLETAEGHTALLIELEEYRADRTMEIGSIERERALKNHMMLVDSIRKGYWAMGEYTTAFYKHGANMGRVFNAMMMRGFTEMVASYIEGKTEQARMDALMYAAYAIAALATGQWDKAATYGIAAAKFAVIGGVGALAAGAIRAYGQSKAEAMTQESEQWEADAFSGEDTGDMEGTRRTASGVVNGRPVIINIMSKVDIRSGVTVFGDSEDGLEEFYGEHIRDYIQDDIEAGIIAIPA